MSHVDDRGADGPPVQYELLQSSVCLPADGIAAAIDWRATARPAGSSQGRLYHFTVGGEGAAKLNRFPTSPILEGRGRAYRATTISGAKVGSTRSA